MRARDLCTILHKKCIKFCQTCGLFIHLRKSSFISLPEFFIRVLLSFTEFSLFMDNIFMLVEFPYLWFMLLWFILLFYIIDMELIFIDFTVVFNHSSFLSAAGFKVKNQPKSTM